MPRLPSSTLLVINTTIGTILPLIFWPALDMTSTLAFPHIDGEDRQVNSHSDTIWN